MPRAGVPNNPSGANSWEGFGDEAPYGEATKQKTLAGGAPLAGARIAAGAIAAPKRASRRAQGAQQAQPAAAPAAGLPAPPMEPSYDARLAMQWAALAAVPGASDLVKQYAAVAQQRVAGA